MKISEKQLKSLLAEVEAELEDVLKSSNLKKNETLNANGGEGAGSILKADPGLGDEGAGGEASAGGPPPGEGDMGEGSPAGPADASPTSAPEEGAMGGDPAMDQVDPEALKQEYASLPPDQLKMHYMACKQALMEIMGAQGAAGPEASAGPGPGASAGGPPPGPEGSPTFKSEAKIRELEKTVAGLGKVVDILTKPMRKAVTDVAFVPRTDEGSSRKSLSKSEVTEKLRDITAEGRLKKSDKDLVMKFYSGQVNADALSHLFDK